MKKLMSVLTIAVLPLSLLIACQSSRHMDRAGMDRTGTDRTGMAAAPASDRFSSADQERIMVSQMNLNRAGDQSDLTASERDNLALRNSLGGKTLKPRTAQATDGSTNEIASAKGLPRNDSGRLSQRYSDQPPAVRDESMVIVPVEPMAPSSEVADIGRYEPDFRQDYESNFANSGYGYDQYRPAYRYGYELASDPRYNSSDWSGVEMQARRNWNEGTMGPWERYKDAVRYGWERARQAAMGRS